MNALLAAKSVAISGRLAETCLSIGRGQLVCLVGPNGSGKTSLLHGLAGVGTASGEVRVDGIDPKGLAPNRRQRLFTYLPASRDLKWPLSAADLIALGLPRGACSEETVARLELGGMLERRVDQMSTGERSRVLIARALAPDPKLLLLDEPTANLDPLWQLKLMAYLRELAHDRGKAILLAVHDLDVALHSADRLIMMQDGRVAADGEPQALLKSPHMKAIFGIERHSGAWRPAC
ncbi:MAG: ABC transporter ATP-binding protein [Sphingosinicella sp.]|nr:ABC transporter ATP-binding protein [Sphingosinicella sp.]